jgi:hypothetical protein
MMRDHTFSEYPGRARYRRTLMGLTVLSIFHPRVEDISIGKHGHKQNPHVGLSFFTGGVLREVFNNGGNLPSGGRTQRRF